ncbi:MAG: hypothetical protein ACYDHO_01875 [Gaiellaceae bacterium]
MAVTVPKRFQPMQCRACQRVIKPNASLVASLGKRLTVHSHDDCIYRCECGASYSNAKAEAKRVMIAARPELNVPKEVRSGLAEVLGQAINRRNRRNKLTKFCFETSEDAVTWTVLRGLEQQGRLDALVAPQRPLGEPTLLLWGVPIGGPRGAETAAALAEVCHSLGESVSSLTEPDVIALWQDLLVLVEAKFQSANERRPNYRGFERYLDRPDLFAAQPEEVAADGYYELTRNWRIGAELAERLRVPGFLLLNLGPPEKIEVDADLFGALVARSVEHDFGSCSWSDVLEAAQPIEPWLDRYASERHRLLYWR